MYELTTEEMQEIWRAFLHFYHGDKMEQHLNNLDSWSVRTIGLARILKSQSFVSDYKLLEVLNGA